MTVHRAETTDASIDFDATVLYEVELAGGHVDDDFISKTLSWPTDMIDFLTVSYEGEDFEEMGIGEKIGPSVISDD